VLTTDVFHGRAKGVLLRDLVNGKEEHVGGIWIINATGPWTDRVCHRSGIALHQPMIGGIRGSHIVLPRFPGAPHTAVYTEAADGRAIFVIPWNDQILVGSTEVSDTGNPAKAQPSAEEIDYLLSSVQQLFPSAKLSYDAIRYAFAGVRPLPFSRNRNANAITRRHYLHDHGPDGASNMLSVIGGKLTTAGQLARECAAKLAGRRPIAPRLVIDDSDVGAAVDNWALQVAAVARVSETCARSMVEWYGKRSLAVARMAAAGSALRAPICSHTEHIVAEAVYALHREFALGLGDVLLRRVPVALGACWSEQCSREGAVRIAAAMGWSAERAAAELESFELERSSFLRKPAGTPIEAAAD
jgi:glycerol-3-phosphate dehydrogenase